MIEHNIDKTSRFILRKYIPTFSVLGVRIASVDIFWLKNFIANHIKDMSGQYICVSNVHTTVMAFENHEYFKIQGSSIMSLPDGQPLVFIGRWLGHKEVSRIAGPDLMDAIYRMSLTCGYRHFFYGSSEETLHKLKKNLLEKYPGLIIVGMISPPFREVTEEEDKKFVNIINNSNADFVWIGLGAPKQEEWMYKHQGMINGLMIGVGAGFDYHAQNIKRAPKWMQKSGLEWVYRLVQEPQRLFKRYLTSNIKFIFYVVFHNFFKNCH